MLNHGTVIMALDETTGGIETLGGGVTDIEHNTDIKIGMVVGEVKAKALGPHHIRQVRNLNSKSQIQMAHQFTL